MPMQPLALWAFGALQTISTAGVVWIIKTVYRLDKGHAVMRVVLTGENGNNGLKGDVKALRDSHHSFRNKLNELNTNHELLTQRVERLEQ